MNRCLEDHAALGVDRDRLALILRLCESVNEFIEFTIRQDGRVMSPNPGLCRLLRASPGELAGLSATSFLRSVDLAWLLDCARTAQGPRIIHLSDLTGGRVSVRALALSQEGAIHVVGMLASSDMVESVLQLQGLSDDLMVQTRELTRQRRALEYRVSSANERELELVTAMMRTAESARTDPLTGLCNRRALDEQLPVLLERAETAGRPVTLLVIDLDHFKRVNDSLGHEAGDAVLVAVATILKSGVRADDLVVRMGGEELAVILPGMPAESALDFADKLRLKVSGLTMKDGLIRITASIGVATWRGRQETVAAWFARGDGAMYQAKTLGRDRCVVDGSAPEILA